MTDKNMLQETGANNNFDNDHEQDNKFKKVVRKGLTISLCAVLAGGLAAGAFEGVNRVTGWNQGTQVEAASNEEASGDDVTLTLTKSEKKDNSDSSDKKDSTTVKGSLDVSEIAEEAMPSVVSITTKSIQEVQSYYSMFGYGGYAPQQREVEGSGSGIIIGQNDDQLLIATNYHVVEGAETLSVAFVDGNACEATVKGFDEEKDLAVVAVALDEIEDETMDAIKTATIGSSDDLKVGEQVVAIGNALGYGQSVTTGIVSAKNRRFNSDSSVVSNDDSSDGVNLIQTDAAINPGNSGGALLNMDGEVVGINSAKLASTEVEGMGYAIAISDVSDILENLMNEEPRERLDDDEHGMLGIKGSTVSEEAVQIYGIPAGVFVSEVTEGEAAEEAGIKANSVITKINGKSVSSIDQLIEYLYYYAPGEDVEITMQVPKGDGYKEKTVTVTLGENTNAKADTKKKKESTSDEEEEDSDDDSILKDWEDEMEESGNPFRYFQSDFR